MKQKTIIATRAGAGLPPAFAWRAFAHSLVPGLLLVTGVVLALALVLGLTSCSHAPAVRTLPDSPHPSTPAGEAVSNTRSDSLERAAWAASARVRADSLALARADSLALARADSIRAAAANPSWGWGTRDAAAPDSARRLTGASAPRADSAGAPFDYLWVVRTAILSPAAVDQVVARARDEGVRGLLVQVVGRGDAFYRSDHLPRAEALPPGDFDPLGRLLTAAHAAGLEVHAWINCMLAWSAPHSPRDPKHVVNAHPEWITRLKDGRSLARLTPRQRERLGLEGVFLAPAHPGVRTWVANTAREIVERYPVDGIHLDYIRQPVVAVGWDPTTRARFALETGVDPALFDRVTGPERARIDSLWLAFRCEQVRATVQEVRDSVHAVRPGLALSAAVIADTLTAERHNAQRWRDWLRSGLLDRAYIMCYAPPVQTVLDQLLGVVLSLGAGSRVVPGIAVYNSPPASAAAKLKGARAMGFSTLAVYSYDALAGQPGYWDRLRELSSEAP